MSSRIRPILLGLLLPLLTACGNSTDVNVTSPTISRCAVAASVSNASVPATGGSGTLTVTTERECGWSAAAESGWITLSSTAGQGPGTITYSAAANPASVSRRGAVVVEQQRVEIAQEAAPCRYDVDPRAVAVSSTGETASVTITTSGDACAWGVQTTAAWVAPDRTGGIGNGTVRLEVAPNPAAEARSATVTVAGVAVTVSQASPSSTACSYVVSPSTVAVPAGGTEAAVTVATTAGCSWVSSSAASWVTVIAGGAGTGSGAVRLRIVANDGAARTAAVLIAGQPITVSQAANTPPTCSYAIAPASQSVGFAGTSLSVEVSAPVGCPWSATSESPWIVVVAGGSGSGAGTVRLAIAANIAAQRAGRVLIAGLGFQVQQAAAPVGPCTYSLKPNYYNAGRGPDDVSVLVTTAAGCSWTVAGDPSWVTVVEGRSGAGSGTVRLVIGANAGAPRGATLNIGGEAFALTQAGNCSASIKPTHYNSGRGPDEFAIAVTMTPGCPWTASSPVDWAIVRSGGAGSGDGDVIVRVLPNNQARRTTTLTIAGQPFTLTQEGR